MRFLAANWYWSDLSEKERREAAFYNAPMSRLAERVHPAFSVPRSQSSGGAQRLSAARLTALLAAASTYALIVLGGVVRATGSGLGCPDWPLCHGGALPPAEAAAIIEYSHRVLAGLTAGLVLLASALTLRDPASTSVRVVAAAGPLVVVAQIALGALTVAWELPPAIVTLHLALALLLLGLLVFQAVWLSARPLPEGEAGQARDSGRTGEGGRPWSVMLPWGAVAAVFVLALSGALVRSSGASLACMGFPLCNGQLWPTDAGPLVHVHLLHRFLALSVAIYLWGVCFRFWRTSSRAAPMARWAGAAALLVLLQGLIGAVGVSLFLPPAVQVLHVAGAAALWATVVGLVATAVGPPAAIRGAR